MTFRLSNPVVPLPGESLPGVIMRNAERYRFHDPARLLRRLGRPKSIVQTVCQADPQGPLDTGLRDLLGIEETRWRQMVMATDDDTRLRLNGHMVWREQVRVDRRFVCPDCVEESPHHRAIWFTDTLSVCAKHRTRLISECPACSAPLRWCGMGVQSCGIRRCRFDLRHAPRERVPEDDMDGVRALDRMFHCDDPTSQAPLGLGFGELLRLCIVIGHVSQGYDKVSRLPGFIARHRAEMHRFVGEGWRALDDWPNGFHRLLDGLKAKAGERLGKGGLRKSFGSFANRIYHWSREPWGAPIGEVFAIYVVAQPSLAVNAHALARYASEDALRYRHISLTEAAKVLQVGPQTMQRLAEKRNLYVLAPSGPGVSALLKAADVQKLRSEIPEFVLPEEARRLLNVGRKVFDKLEAAGLLVRVSGQERFLDIKPFRRSEMRSLVDACRGDAPVITDAEARERGLWTLASITAPGREPPEVIRAMMSGRLRAAALVRGQAGLKGIRMEPADVERVLPTKRTTMSAVEVGELIGVSYWHVLHWARLGLMATTEPGGPDEVGMRFSQEGVDTFKREYLLGGELARMSGQTGRLNGAVTRHLKFLGVPMVSGHAVGDGGKLAVYRRADVTPEVLARVQDVRQRKVMPTRELRKMGFDRVAMAAAVIGRLWRMQLSRVNNRYTDQATGRVVQVVSGRRPDLTGVFMFSVQRESLELLRSVADPWVALVPNQGDTFLLIPLPQVRWRGATSVNHITVRFDGQGRPQDFIEFAHPLGEPEQRGV